jgi:hypothetical protein
LHTLVAAAAADAHNQRADYRRHRKLSILVQKVSLTGSCTLSSSSFGGMDRCSIDSSMFKAKAIVCCCCCILSFSGATCVAGVPGGAAAVRASRPFRLAIEP